MRSELSSRVILLGLAALFTSACGNYSNEDIEFYNALPLRRQLEAKVPQPTAEKSAGLVRQGLGELGAEPELYSGAKEGSNNLNKLLWELLKIIDRIRELPPTRREPNKRIWGPFDAEGQVGFQARVVMVREESAAEAGPENATFSWSIEFRRRIAPKDAPWLVFVRGTAVTKTGSFGQANGQVQMLAREAREGGLLTAGLDEVMGITIDYDSMSEPLTLQMKLEAKLASLEYGYVEQSDQSGSFHYDFKADLIPGNPGEETLSVAAAWIPNGAGRAEASVDLEGYQHLRQVECWDAAFKAVYVRNDFEAGAPKGSADTCALLSLP